MNEQITGSATESGPLSRREMRRQRHAAKREILGGGGSLSWIAGLLLILLGGGFLLQNLGFFIPLDNWWALFIMLPALGAFEVALRAYRRNGNRLVASARASLLSGAILSIITAAFLFELDWTYFGPALIILAGIGVLINYTLLRTE